MYKRLLLIFAAVMFSVMAFGQFEEPQLSGEEFEKLKVHVGADFALQYQILNHHADSALIPLGTGFNLPTANLNLDAVLAPGIKVNLVTYLSARHHNEAWVKGGYLVIDELPFLKSEGIDRIMDYLTLRVGDMEIDYGDAHYRRTDNGRVITNPFVGNYIMDAFTTAPSLDIMFRKNCILAMGGLTTGNLRQDLVSYSGGTYTSYDAHKELGFYWKAGFDKQFNDNIRTRLTISGFHAPERTHRSTLYNGDRTGSRYYLVMKRITNSASDVDITSGHTTGNWGPGTATKDNSFMVNLFTKLKGFELFGTYETAKGLYASGNEFKFNQIGVEGLYRFGGQEQFYAGARYNMVNGNTNTASADDQSVNRIQIGAGWFLIKSVLIKIEYMKQNYKDFIDLYGKDAGFDGVMFEAAVSF
jgi:hypothetical protein